MRKLNVPERYSANRMRNVTHVIYNNCLTVVGAYYNIKGYKVHTHIVYIYTLKCEAII